MVTCPNCGHEVPDGSFCVRCGARLSDGEAGRRRGFAAAPHESRLSPRLISTLFPHLPRADLTAYRIAFVVGLATMAGLAIGGLYPLALVAAAVFVPLVV